MEMGPTTIRFDAAPDGVRLAARAMRGAARPAPRPLGRRPRARGERRAA